MKVLIGGEYSGRVRDAFIACGHDAMSCDLLPRRKARGCVPGVPDMEIHHNGRSFFIEIKTPKGTVSKIQKDMHQRLKRAGHAVAVCRSLEDVLFFLESHGVPLKGTVMA